MMGEDDAYAALSNIFREVFMRDIDLRPDLTAADVAGWDSFKQIEIILALEEQYKIKFPIREVDALQNVGDLARALIKKVTK